MAHPVLKVFGCTGDAEWQLVKAITLDGGDGSSEELRKEGQQNLPKSAVGIQFREYFCSGKLCQGVVDFREWVCLPEYTFV